MTAVDFQLSIIICVLFVIVALVFAGFWQHEYENALKDRNKWRDKYYRAEEEGMYEHEALVRMRQKYFALQKEHEVLAHMRYKYINLQKEHEELKYQLYQHQLKPQTASNADMLYAVKYAMKHAHPDKGGKQEDFIRFNEMYQRMKH